MVKLQVKEKNSKLMLLWVFLAAFIPRAILCLFAEPVSIISDEVATIAGGAYWAGLDWSSVVSHAGYYGTGFTAFTAIFFKLTGNPKLLFVLITLYCSLAQSITAPIAYHILEKYFKLINRKFMFIASIAASYFVMTTGIVVFNEHGIILVSWLVTWLLLKLQACIDNKWKKRMYTVLLLLVLSYGLTIHTRMILLWIVLPVVVLFYFWTYRKWLISIPVALCSGGLGYAATKMYVSFSQSQIWKAADGTGSSLRNASVGTGGLISSLKLLFNPESWQAWFNIIFGQLHTVAVFSGGLFIILMIMFIHFIWNKLVRKYWDEEHQWVEAKMMPVVVFFALCIAGTIAGQSLTWLKGSMDVIQAGFENSVYDSKAYGYLRYFGPYCGPIILMGTVYFYYWKDKIVRYKVPVFTVLGFLEFYWLVCIFPYLFRTDQIGALEFYYPFALKTLESTISWKTILPASLALWIAVFLYWWFIKKRKIIHIVTLLSCLCIYSYFYLGITWGLGFQDMYKVYAYDSYNLLAEVDDEVDIPYEIYVDDSWKWEDHNNFFLYQILLPRHKIIPEMPSEDLTEVLVFTNDTYTEDNYKKYTDQGYKYCKLGEYELILVKGQNLQQQFLDAGVELMGE